MAEETRALVPADSKLVPSTLDEIQRWAKMFEASGLFKDAQGFAAVCVKIAAGAEIGMPPFASMRGIHIVQGQPALGAHIIAGKIKASGRYNYRIVEHSEKVCELAFFENGGEVGRSRFTIEDAQRAGIKRPGSGWDKYTRAMLYARALTQGARWYCADAFQGAVYTREELREAPLEAEAEVVSPPPAAPPTVADVVEEKRQACLEDFDAVVATGAKPSWWDSRIGFGPEHIRDLPWDAFLRADEDGTMVAAWAHKMIGGAKKAIKDSGGDTEDIRSLDLNHLALQIALTLRDWYKRHGDPETGEVLA